MNWWEWVFSGIGVAVLMILVGLLKRRDSGKTPSITAQGAKVSNSPVASGTGITQKIETHHHYAQAPGPSEQKPELSPNLQIVGANNILIEVSENDVFERSSDDEGPVAAVVHVTNDAQPGSNVGAVVRATLIYHNSGKQFLRVSGAWLGELADSVDFHVDDAHTVIIGVKSDWQFVVPGKRYAPYDVVEGAGYRTDSHPLELDSVSVTVRLTNADTGAFYCERQFQVQINPSLGIQMVS